MNTKKEGQLVTLSTTNYSIFKKIKGNRPLQKSHLNNLMKSLVRKNLLEINPILVNKKYEIIDGQHRFEAAKKLQVPIYYTIVEGMTSKDSFENMLILNTYARPWGLLDFLGSYVELGNPAYIRVKELYEETGFLGLMRLISLLSGPKRMISFNGAKVIRNSFREGTYEITDEEFGLTMIEYLKRMKPFMAFGVWNDKEFLGALVKHSQTGSVDKLISKLEESGKILFRRVLRKEYTRDFEDILAIRGYYNTQDVV